MKRNINVINYKLFISLINDEFFNKKLKNIWYNIIYYNLFIKSRWITILINNQFKITIYNKYNNV